MNAFGEKYSTYYDLIYSDKDYEKECDYLEEIFRRYYRGKVERIIDVACGTGGHAIPLARRDYFVHASDISSSMLELAKKKATSLSLDDRITFEHSDMRTIQMRETFDVCICMFASLDYLLDYDDVLRAFRSIHGGLVKGGLLIFDFWNGLAVITTRPSERVKVLEMGTIHLVRLAKPKLDPIRNINYTEYTITVIENGLVKEQFKEIHTVRYFYPEEIRYLLKVSGYELLSLHSFLLLDSEVTVKDWNVTAVAKKV